MPFDPIDTLVSTGQSALNWALNSVSQNHQNKVNAREAQKQRDWASSENEIARNWQSSENSASRDWQQKMWNLENQYNTPSAMMQRYKDAGLNPYLAGGQIGAASSDVPSASSVGAPPSLGGSAASVGSPLPADFDIMRGLGVSADAADSRAKAVNTLWRTASEIYQNMGKAAFEKFVSTHPEMTGSDPASALAAREAAARIHQMDVDTAVQDYGLSLTKKFGEKERWQAISESQQRISESVARLQVQQKMTDAEIEEIATRCIRNLAETFKLRMEGAKLKVDAATASQLQQYIVSIATSDAQMRANQATESNALTEGKSSFFGWLTSPHGKDRYSNQFILDNGWKGNPVGRTLDKFFEYINIGVGGYLPLGPVKGGNTYNNTAIGQYGW